MSVFIMEYRVIGYTIADALRLNPKWGKRTFFVNSDDIGTTDIDVVRVAASSPENTPEGYKLFSIRDRDAEVEVKP